MDEKPQPVKLGYYLDILSRRRWYLIVPFCVVMSIGIILAITLPRIYSAETLIVFQPQEVPEDYVRSVDSIDLESTIDTISRQIMSRANLKKIVNQFDLFTGPEAAEMSTSEKITSVREQILVDWVELIDDAKQRDGTKDTFYISFKGEDPQQVMQVTNALATQFIDESLQTREAKAVDTSVFLEEEIQAKRKQLEAFELKLKGFRERHMGGLPEQLGHNLATIDRLEGQLNVKQEHLLDAKNRLILINNQMSEVQNMSQYQPAVRDDLETNPYLRLQRMKQELEDLNSRYTPQHPDVIRLKGQIAELEQQIKTGAAMPPEVLSDDKAMEHLNPYLAERRSSLLQQTRETKLDIQKLNAEIAKIQNKIVSYQEIVEQTPQKEQELQLLERDYENINKSYNSLLDQKMQAELAVSLEKKKKGEQFRLLRQAWLPSEPTEPNLKKIFLLTVILALNLGAGLVFLLEYFDTSVRQVNDLESDLGIPVLVTIPKIFTSKEKAKYRINSLLTFASMVFAVTICAAFVVLVINGLEGTMEMINEFMADS
jgi:polysaccharide chain length determinant protein (PEP-CTERM system associated)